MCKVLIYVIFIYCSLHMTPVVSFNLLGDQRLKSSYTWIVAYHYHYLSSMSCILNSVVNYVSLTIDDLG